MDASLFTDPLWVWLAVAAAILSVEVATGSGYLLWASASAGVVAVLHGLGLRLGWGGEVVVFAVLAIGSTLAARRFWPRRPPSPGDDINDADARLVGREGRAVAAFHDTHGRVFVDGKEWAADAESASPLPAGGRVEVLSVLSGSRLQVRGLGPHADALDRSA